MEKKTEIVVKIKKAEWQRIIAKEQIAIIQHTRPFEKEFPCPFNIYFYVQKQKAVCGFGIVDKIIKTHTAEGLAEEIGIPYTEQQKFAKGEQIYCWYLKRVTEYQEKKPIEDYGLKRSPHDYRYITAASKDLKQR